MKRYLGLLVVLFLALSVPAWGLAVSVRVTWELPVYYAVSDTDCSNSAREILPADRGRLQSVLEYSVGGGAVQTVATSGTSVEIGSAPVGTEIRARVKSFLPGGDGCWTDWATFTVPVPRVGCGKIVEFKVLP